MNAQLKMTRRTTLAAAMFACLAGAAWAESPTPDPYKHMVFTASRAQVLAELRAALASGQLALATGEDSGSFQLARQVSVAGRTRAEVRAEVLAARQSGELEAMNGEDSGSFHLARLDQRRHADEAVRMALKR